MSSASTISSVDKSDKMVPTMQDEKNDPRCALYLYTDECSADHSSQRDAEIGVFRNLVGSNKNLGTVGGTSAFVIYKDPEGIDMIRFAGFTGNRSDSQPWMQAGGSHWDHVYSVSHGGSRIRTLSEFTTDFGLRVSIIKSSTRCGWPRVEIYRPAFQRSIRLGYWN